MGKNGKDRRKALGGFRGVEAPFSVEPGAVPSLLGSGRDGNRCAKASLRQGSGNVRAKKGLGQHFLKNEDIARVIARCVHPEYRPVLMPDGSLDLLTAGGLSRNASEFGSTPLHVLEVGPGMGVLSRCLWEDPALDVKLVELDRESVVYLASHFPEHTRAGKLVPADFLQMDLREVFGGESFVLTGNFPYNISSQILFRVLENRDWVPLMAGMFQKEVGERVCAKPGSKTYGILSVLLQAFYRTEYLFTVEPGEFLPPPKVRSCVVRLTRNEREGLGCDEEIFVYLVKKAFNQRRKTLRNAFKGLEEEKGFPVTKFPAELLDKRAEQLSVEDYACLARILQPGG